MSRKLRGATSAPTAPAYPATHIAAKLAANVAAMCSAPDADSLRSDPPARASKGRANRPLKTIAGCHVPCDRLRYRLRHPRRKQNVFLCVRSSKTPHTSRAPTASRSPCRRIKTHSVPCVPPARAPPFWRYACPPRWARTPQGVQPVGQAATGCGGSRPRRVAAFRGRRVRGVDLTAQELRGGLLLHSQQPP